SCFPNAALSRGDAERNLQFSLLTASPFLSRSNPRASFSSAKERSLIRTYQGRMPRIADSAYIDPQAVIIGDVTIAADSSVWPCTVIRGDVNYIRIGSRTNIQDGSVLHVMRDTHPLILGDNVTVGHGVVLHGCTIE